MDKDLLRIVIIISGILVMVGMVYWSYLRNRKSDHSFNFYDDQDPLGKIDESLIIKTDDDDFEIIPLGSAVDDEIVSEEHEDFQTVEKTFRTDDNFPAPDEQETIKSELDESTTEIPALILFSVMAPDKDEFNGAQLIPVLELVGLVYGSTLVFERLDVNNLVNFTVASIVEPGTFPLDDLDSFTCPGLAFFMQPKAFENPVEVFDDFVAVLHQVSGLLGGVEWDASREPLTEETILYYRRLLSTAQ